MPKAITSLEGFIRKIAGLNKSSAGIQLYYRGHSSLAYEIRPSVFRSNNHKAAEHLMIRQLVAQHPKDFINDVGIFDQLVRAQHYGLPTRLLDITLNPLVALYFAVSSNPKKRASVIVFKPEIAKQRYYDSDVVSCLSGLALMTDGEKSSLAQSAAKSYKANADKATKLISGAALEEFNSQKEVEKLVQLIRHEKSDFRPIIQPIDLARPVAVTPRKNHSRIIAQNGAFIIFGLVPAPNRANMGHIAHETIHIEQDRKPQFMRELAEVGITESALFPEIEKAALAIKRRYE